jgi:hypothetical protein
LNFSWEMLWQSWLRHCATSRKIAGSIADGAIGIFYWLDLSGCNMSLWSRRPVRRADNLTTFMCRLSWNVGASASWNPQGLSIPVMGLLYIFLWILISSNIHTCQFVLNLKIRHFRNTHARARAHTHTHIYIYTYIHTHTYSHTHTHIITYTFWIPRKKNDHFP